MNRRCGRNPVAGDVFGTMSEDVETIVRDRFGPGVVQSDRDVFVRIHRENVTPAWVRHERPAGSRLLTGGSVPGESPE